VIHLRRLVATGAFLVAMAGIAVVAWLSLREESEPIVLGPRETPALTDLLAHDEEQAEELTRAAVLGLSHPLYTRSPGGVFASARRTDNYRDMIEDAVAGSEFDADLVEAIVFLESGGRPEVIAGDDPIAAAGLTQILAETAQNFLGMKVDLDASRSLTVRIEGALRRGNLELADRLRAERRAVDHRFAPRRALAGTVRYLTAAHQRLGKAELAVVSYHMGIGNLTNVIYAYTGASTDAYLPDLVEEDDITWPKLFFDTAPDRFSQAHGLLAELGDDSPTYYWRVLAAQEIMRLYREDEDELRELELLHRAKSSHEEVLHPPSDTERYADATDLRAAWEEGTLHPLPDDRSLGFAIDRELGELAPQLDRPKTLYRGLRAEALAVLVYIGKRVREISESTRPLRVTSAVRDDEYQELLRDGNPEAAHGYSLHTTGYAFDIRRRYQSGEQAQAFQFLLDDLTARGLIAWIREPGAIHITVSDEAEALVEELLEPAQVSAAD
jgi:hypothetical protein